MLLVGLSSQFFTKLVTCPFDKQQAALLGVQSGFLRFVFKNQLRNTV